MHRLLLILFVLLLLAMTACSRSKGGLTAANPDTSPQTPSAGQPTDLEETHAALSLDSNGQSYERYVVVLNSGATDAQRDALMATLSKQPDQVYKTVYKGFAGYLTAGEAATLKAAAGVRMVEKDGYVYAADGWTEDDIMQHAYPWVPLGLMPQQDSPEVVKYLSAQTTDWGVQRIGAHLNTGNRGTGVTVAVLDTGCDLTHSDLAGAYLYSGGQPISYNVIYPSRPADDGQGHGTHCAGIIGARDNTFGTVGVAPDCNIIAVKVLSDRGWGLNSWVISGIDWVAANAGAHNIRVGSLSLGGGFHAATNAAIDAGSLLGMTYVCAAGNNYGQTANFSPASAAQAISVSSLQNGTTNPATDYFSTFSNWGTTVEVIAPGTGIFAPFRGNRYATLSGTSMACPHAAACCALWFSTHTGSGGTGNRTDVLAALVARGYSGTPGGWPTVPAQSRPDPDGVTEPLVQAQYLSALPTWHTYIADDPGHVDGVGHFSSMEIVNGNPALAFRNNQGALKYVRAIDAAGTSWSTPMTLAAVIPGQSGMSTSLAIVNSKPAIAYHHAGSLRYIIANDANGAAWGASVQLDTINQHFEGRVSLSVVNARPAIAYYDALNADLKYIRAADANGSAWGSPLAVDASGAVGQFASLAVISSNPAISYFDATNGDLKFIRASNADGTAWNSPMSLDTSGTVGRHTSLAVINGNAAISYYRETGLDLMFIRASNGQASSWGTPIAAETAGNVGTYTSLATVNGNPAIAYMDSSNEDLKYVRATNANGTGWGTPLTLDSQNSMGFYPTLRTASGNPAIGYRDNTSGFLKYIRSTNADGGAWDTPLIVDARSFGGVETSLAIVNGRPAASHFESIRRDLRYVRAADSQGTTWGAPVVVDATGNTGNYSSLAFVNGRPAISYHDETAGDLRFVRATDADGTTWQAPITLDSTGVTGLFTSLLVLAGNPAVAYHDQTNGDLRFIRATNADGTAWSAPVTVDASGTAGFFLSMAIVNGNPGIAYYESVGRDLRFVRATAADGSSWGAPQIVASTGFVGYMPSLAVVNGNPAISFTDITSQAHLCYVRALDADGLAWAAHATIDGANEVGYYSSLAFVGGLPAVAYFDNTNRYLNFIEATDSNGTSWTSSIVLDNTGFVGREVSLGIVNGDLGITYQDFTNGDMKFAVRF